MDTDSNGITRLERILAYMVAGVVGVSILCFFAVLIGSFSGQGVAQQSGKGIWNIVIMFPYFGLPFGMLLVLTLIAVSIIRRKREVQRQSS